MNDYEHRREITYAIGTAFGYVKQAASEAEWHHDGYYAPDLPDWPDTIHPTEELKAAVFQLVKVAKEVNDAIKDIKQAYRQRCLEWLLAEVIEDRLMLRAEDTNA